MLSIVHGKATWTSSFLQIHRAPFSFKGVEQYEFYAPIRHKPDAFLFIAIAIKREQLIMETYIFLSIRKKIRMIVLRF